MAKLDSEDIGTNDSNNETFQQVLDARLSRRGFVGGGLATAAGLTLGGVGALLKAVPASAHGRGSGPLLGFQGIAVSTADTVVVPQGYTAEVLIAWGDPVSNGPAFNQDASNSAADQVRQWGMHNDGLVYFPIDGSRRGLLVQNHEYTDDGLLFTDGVANWNAEKTNKSLNAHGVSILEIKRGRDHDDHNHRRWRTPWHSKDSEWRVVSRSKYARRITAETPIRIAGPAAGHPLMSTSADPKGREVLGMLNNCANGVTPWGTYLTCEENFNGYFQTAPANAAVVTAHMRRYGIAADAGGFGPGWNALDTRFDLAAEPNESNRFGWTIEIDPRNPPRNRCRR